MKKKVICIFSLLLYLLLVCTMLSAKIEEEMMPQVEVRTLQYRGSTLSFSPNVLFHDANGEHFYDVIDGSGWESGLRAQEISPGQWYVDNFDQIAFSGSAQKYRFIMSASRQPRVGEKVKIVDTFEEVEDVHLYCYPYGVPADVWLPQNASIVSQSSNVLLIRNTKARLPFFQHTAKTLSIAASLSSRAFSLMEIRSFLETLPSIALLLSLLLSGVFIMGISCLPGIQKNKGMLWLNICLMVCCLGGSGILLNQIDLPSSLLPESSIFDFTHYTQTFSLIFESLRQCGETALLGVRDQATAWCIMLLAGGGVLLFVILFAEIYLTRRKH